MSLSFSGLFCIIRKTEHVSKMPTLTYNWRSSIVVLRKVWRFQRANQKSYINEWQTMQWMTDNAMTDRQCNDRQTMQWMTDNAMNDRQCNEWQTMQWMTDRQCNEWQTDNAMNDRQCNEWQTMQWMTDEKGKRNKQWTTKHYTKN
jgi:hypothetical protein